MNLTSEKQQTNAIFDATTYQSVYEADLQQADKEIVISSPGMNKAMVTKTLDLIKNRQLTGVSVNESYIGNMVYGKSEQTAAGSGKTIVKSRKNGRFMKIIMYRLLKG